MGRVLILLAAIPLVCAGYLVRDSDLIARGTLYAQAYLLGAGGSDVARPEPVTEVARARPVPASATELFYTHGKGPRADRSPLLDNTQTAQKRPRMMVASMTPHARTASVSGEDNDPAGINRTAKGQRLAPPEGSQVLLSHASAEAPGLHGPPYPESDRASAAIFMLAPTSVSGFIDDEKVEDPGPIAWPGRLHIEQLKTEDGSSLFGGFSEEEFRVRELRCMTAAIYFEARSESRRGQIAVAQVVMNRVRANVYPDTACGVIFQGQWNRNACQFSFACDGKPERADDKVRWQEAKQLAREVMRGDHWLSDIGYATHYHATYVRPHWAPHFKRVKQIGQHIFYKAPNIRVHVADLLDDL